MSRPTLLIDLERCIGCFSCHIACKQENGVPAGVNRIEVFEIGSADDYPNVKGYYLPRPCMHCEEPPCVKACPTKASYRREDGIVLIEHDECILCKNCIRACPFGARDYNHQAKQIECCTMCVHRADGGKKPACAAHCMGQALIFGDLNNPQSEVSQYLAVNKERALHWLEGEGTKPRVIYLAPKCGVLAGAERMLSKTHKTVQVGEGLAKERTNYGLINTTQARGSVYRFLSRIWRGEIDKALWTELQRTSFPALPEIPELDEAYRRLEKALHDTQSGILEELATDYATLLGADPRMCAHPYESVHRSPEGLMMQDEWEQVLRCYIQAGLQRSKGTTEVEDHLALELECMAHLCKRMANSLKAGAGREAMLALEQQLSMLGEHLLQWVPSFTDRMLQSAKTEFYRTFAVITRELLKMDQRLLKETALLLEDSHVRF